jgi:hypothetical protein
MFLNGFFHNDLEFPNKFKVTARASLYVATAVQQAMVSMNAMQMKTVVTIAVRQPFI